MSTKRVFFCVSLIWILGGCEHKSSVELSSDEDSSPSIKADLLTGKSWLWLESYDPSTAIMTLLSNFVISRRVC
jgi:hypothetical protein